MRGGNSFECCAYRLYRHTASSTHFAVVAGIPQNATGVLRIDPRSREVTTIGQLPLGGWKWHGGVVAADGVIYSLPAHANTVLRIDPKTQSVSEIGGPLKSGRHRTDGKYKYLGGVLGKDGKIYGIPSDADYVLCIDPLSQVRASHALSWYSWWWVEE